MRDAILQRHAGWEMRLAAVVESARGEPYELGRHDCFRFACRAVQALTGVDLWSNWAGTYRTRAQALRRIAEYGGSFDAAFSKLFGAELVSPLQARQGDVLKYVQIVESRAYQVEIPHLGVCLGAEVAVLADDGLRFVPLSSCAAAWRIG